MEPIPASRPFPFATALRAGLRDYSLKSFKDDALAGLVVSLVALPLAMALSIAVGLPPRHGIYTAVVAGIVAALCGGSSTQVSGPTAAFVVIVAPVVAQYGLQGIILCQFMAGAMLVLLGLFRAGRAIRYVPHAVVAGFTAGIAVTIAALALDDFFGLGVGRVDGHFIARVSALLAKAGNVSWPDLAVGGVALLLMVFFPRLSRRVPSPAVGIPVAAVLAWYLSTHGFAPETLATRFSYEWTDGTLRHGLDPRPPVFAWPHFTGAELVTLFPHAVLIAVLAALESLLSATVADSLAHTHHDPDAELTGIGLANIFSGLAAGIPATGAIARTATNIHAAARTPLAAVIHSLLLLAYVEAFSTSISAVPMAALAALLLVTAARMSHAKQCLGILKAGNAEEKLVLAASFLLTVFIDMVAGVGAGLALALLFHMRRKRRQG